MIPVIPGYYWCIKPGGTPTIVELIHPDDGNGIGVPLQQWVSDEINGGWCVPIPSGTTFNKKPLVYISDVV
jgi:hypothetical protein